MTNRELDEALGLAFGDKPTIAHAASKDEGKSVALWTDDIVRKADVEQYCVAHPEYKVVRIEQWPRYTVDIGCSRSLVRQMRERGWSYKFEWAVQGRFARDMITDPRAVFECDDEPFTAVGIDKDEFRAIAIAAGKAMRVYCE